MYKTIYYIEHKFYQMFTIDYFNMVLHKIQ